MKAKSILIFIVAFLLLLSGCALQDELPDSGDNSEESESAVSSEPREIILAKDGIAKYAIVVPEICASDVNEAAKALKVSLYEITGAFFSVTDDYTRNGEIVDSEGEILIGDCKRSDSKAQMEKLTYRDSAVSVNDANILICGYEESKLSGAIEAFTNYVEDENNIIKDGNEIRLKWNGDIFNYYGKYKFDSLTLGSVPLSNYRIVYPKSSESVYEEYYKKYAMDLQHRIGKACGYVLDICSDAEKEQKYEILLGETNRSASRELYTGVNSISELEYGFNISNDKILLSCGGLYTLSYAVKEFDSKITSLDPAAPDINNLSAFRASLVYDEISECSADYRIMSYNILTEYEGWGSGGQIPSSVDVRKELVSGLIYNYMPDVVALQEVTPKWHTALKDSLSDTYAFVSSSMKADPCASMIYNTKRLTLKEVGTPNLITKIGPITWALFEDNSTKEEFIVLCTHLDPRNHELRLSEAEFVGKLAKSLSEQYNAPILVMGDMNSRYGAEEHSVLTSFSGLTMVSKTHETNPYCVDHMFGSSGIEVTATGLEMGNGAQFASDHDPVWIDVNFS